MDCQSLTTRWQISNGRKCVGGTSHEDKAYSIQQTKDGGYIIAGRTISKNGDVSGNNGYYDVWVVKLK